MAEPDVCAPIDANGNLTSDGTKTYLWNALNQLVEVKEGTTTIGSSTDTIRYDHGAGIDEPLARKNSSDVVTYYLADHLGSVVQETSASGSVSLERDYDAWGALVSGPTLSGYAFQGREWDSEIALYYFRARYYNASAGAWTADDPIGFGGGLNFARFVNNNPLRFVDPFGLCGGDGQQPTATTYDPTKYGPEDPTNPGQPLYKNPAVQKAAQRAFSATGNGRDKSGLAEGGFAIQHRNGTISIASETDSVSRGGNGNGPPNQLTIKTDASTIAVFHTHGNSALPTPSPGDLKSPVPNFVLSQRGLYVTQPGTDSFIKLPK